MTLEAINFENETRKHQQMVSNLMLKIVEKLLARAAQHDNTKLLEPERSHFIKHTTQLSKLTYGSDEYKAALRDMQPAIQHHQNVNRHHPEFFDGGIDEMSLTDLVEMICDWMAATKRHEDGDVFRSLSINKERFGISDQLLSILKNTVERMNFGLE